MKYLTDDPYPVAPFDPPGTPANQYRSPDFTYGNWRAHQPYVCRVCDAEGITRPPAAVIEWMSTDGDLDGDFVPVCYSHLHEQEARWWTRFGREDAS